VHQLARRESGLTARVFPTIIAFFSRYLIARHHRPDIILSLFFYRSDRGAPRQRERAHEAGKDKKRSQKDPEECAPDMRVPTRALLRE